MTSNVQSAALIKVYLKSKHKEAKISLSLLLYSNKCYNLVTIKKENEYDKNNMPRNKNQRLSY